MATTTDTTSVVDPVQQAILDAAAAKQGLPTLQYVTTAPSATTTNTSTTTSSTSSSSNSTLSTLSGAIGFLPKLTSWGSKIIGGDGGTVAGAVKAAGGWGTALAGNIVPIASTVISAYSLFSAFQSIFKTGFTSQNVTQLLTAGAGAAVAVYSLGMTLFINMTWAAFMPYVAVALAVIIALAYLLGRTPNAAEQQIANFDNLSVWSSGTVLMLASATAFTLMGYNIDNALTSINPAGISIPTSVLTSLLTNNLSNADGTAYAGSANSNGNTLPYGVPIVLKGAGTNGGDEVLILSANGVKNSTLQAYNLANNMAFTKPATSDLSNGGDVAGYVPFFRTDGSVNPAAVTAVNTSRALLQSTPNLAATSQANAVAVAGAADKQGVVATSVP